MSFVVKFVDKTIAIFDKNTGNFIELGYSDKPAAKPLTIDTSKKVGEPTHAYIVYNCLYKDMPVALYLFHPLDKDGNSQHTGLYKFLTYLHGDNGKKYISENIPGLQLPGFEDTEENRVAGNKQGIIGTYAYSGECSLNCTIEELAKVAEARQVPGEREVIWARPESGVLNPNNIYLYHQLDQETGSLKLAINFLPGMDYMKAHETRSRMWMTTPVAIYSENGKSKSKNQLEYEVGEYLRVHGYLTASNSPILSLDLRGQKTDYYRENPVELNVVLPVRKSMKFDSAIRVVEEKKNNLHIDGAGSLSPRIIDQKYKFFSKQLEKVKISERSLQRSNSAPGGEFKKQ